MRTINDSRLLEEWAQKGTDASFTEIVHRHLPLVWGTARRIVGDTDLARDVAQNVFADLARKVQSLPPTVFLPGWLHRASVHAAKKCVRDTARRRGRETQFMNDPTSSAESSEAEVIATLQPLLDEALATLPESDRDLILLRFFAEKSYSEIGAAAGTSDDTAQKRVSRAIDKLRDYFRMRGVTVGAGAVAASLSLAANTPIPAGIAHGIITSLSSINTVASIGTSLTMKASFLTLSAVTAALALVGIRQHQQLDELTSVNAGLRQQLAQAESRPTPAAPTTDLNSDLMAELLRLRGESAQRQRSTPRAQYDRVAELEAKVASQAEQLAGFLAEAKFEAQLVNRVNALKLLGLSAHVYAAENKNTFPSSFEAMRSELELDANGQFPGKLSPEEFEFFPQPRPVVLGESRFILFREKRSLQKPDGSEIRVYCMGDGAVHRIDGDQSADFELHGTATVESPQPATTRSGQ